MKLETLIHPAFSPAFQKLAQAPLRASVLFRLNDCMALVDENLKRYHKVKDGLIKKHAKKDEAGNPITETTEDGKEYVKDFEDFSALEAEHQELLTQEVGIEPIEVSDADIEKAELTAIDLKILMPLLRRI
jgi:hypothetical protein